MDDVDAVQAQIARNMLQSGDWVTAHLDGVKYLEKSPLKYWMMAVCFADLRRARLGGADSDCSFGDSAVLAGGADGRLGDGRASRASMRGSAWPPALGLWLFTRILIPDVVLTLTIAFAHVVFLSRARTEDEARSARVGADRRGPRSASGMLLKGLIAAVFPVGTAFLYLVFSGLLARAARPGSRLQILPGTRR